MIGTDPRQGFIEAVSRPRPGGTAATGGQAMSCTTCDHTMDCIFDSRERTVWHCSHCGTLRSHFRGQEEDIVPKLPERCRQLEAALRGLLSYPSLSSLPVHHPYWDALAAAHAALEDKP